VLVIYTHNLVSLALPNRDPEVCSKLCSKVLSVKSLSHELCNKLCSKVLAVKSLSREALPGNADSTSCQIGTRTSAGQICRVIARAVPLCSKMCSKICSKVFVVKLRRVIASAVPLCVCVCVTHYYKIYYTAFYVMNRARAGWICRVIARAVFL
jgi:hypothetical protein